jgi:hypothetical protein
MYTHTGDSNVWLIFAFYSVTVVCGDLMDSSVIVLLQGGSEFTSVLENSVGFEDVHHLNDCIASHIVLTGFCMIFCPYFQIGTKSQSCLIGRQGLLYFISNAHDKDR